MFSNMEGKNDEGAAEAAAETSESARDAADEASASKPAREDAGGERGGEARVRRPTVKRSRPPPTASPAAHTPLTTASMGLPPKNFAREVRIVPPLSSKDKGVDVVRSYRIF